MQCGILYALVSIQVGHLFLDNMRVYTKGGAGGNGKPSLGGVGGRGGNVYVVCEANATLQGVKNQSPAKRFIAGAGGHSLRTALLGEPGKDIEIFVPPGVAVRTDQGRTIGELNEPGDRILVTKGGEGGTRNNGFLGKKGQAQSVRLDLKLIADIGLVGFPNAGKSTLLSAVSRAAPKIAAYPFTTIKPQVGVMMYEDLRQISMADLPGLIEGAHVNVGMGHNFLKHVERTKMLLFIVDVHGFRLGINHPQRSAFETVVLLIKELELYKPELLTKPAVLALNKIDIEGAEEKVEKTMKQVENMQDEVRQLDPQHQPDTLIKFDAVYSISAKKRLSTEELKTGVRELMDFHADQEMDAEGKLQNAIANIEASNKEKIGHLV